MKARTTPPPAAQTTPPQRSRRSGTRRVFLKLCGAALGVGVAAPLDAAVIEPHALETTRHDVCLPNLPAHLDGLKVVHLTDLHCGPITPDDVITHAVQITEALHPDIVVLTGDFVHRTPQEAARLGKFLAPLRPRLGMWACLGNHDYNYGANGVADALVHASGNRIYMLRNASHEVTPGLYIAGIEDTVSGHPDAGQALADVPSDSALLFLTHNPVGVWNVTSRPCLALSGHTHGGQVLVPGFPVPMPPGMEGFPLISGWGMFDQARLYVSRGVGMGMAPIRFRCLPEVALHVLRRGVTPPRAIPTLTDRALRRAVRMAARATHRHSS